MPFSGCKLTISNKTVITPLLSFQRVCYSWGKARGPLSPSSLNQAFCCGNSQSFPFRIGKVGNQKRVVGVLLGSWQKKILDVSNSFAGEFGCPTLPQTY